MCDKKEKKMWFYVNKQRAMVSLGPLSSSRTCPYNCAFCYVQDGFIPYEKKTIEEIIVFLIEQRENYSIIYVSGDTDSFAKPRNKEGVQLLKRIAKEIDCDLLFTTRTIFSNNELLEIESVVKQLEHKNRKLYACISITRYSDEVGYLEPSPIPTPQERIETLKKIKQIGAVAVLAMRPFIPVVPQSDYFKILDEVKDHVDIVLGEVFYFVAGSKVEKRVFPDGIPKVVKRNLKGNQHMDFNDNDKDWLVWSSKTLENAIENYCDRNGIIFSMRSNAAIDKFEKLFDRS